MDARGKPNNQADEPEETQLNRDQKRMYSFRQMFDLHKILTNNSDVHDRVTKNEKDLKKVFEELDSLNKQLKQLKKYTDDEIKDFKDQVAEDKKHQESVNGDYKYKLDDHTKQL